MSGFGTADLVCLLLADVSDGRAPTGLEEPVPAGEIAAALELDTGRLADQLTVLSTLSDLVAAGEVAERRDGAGSDGDAVPGYVLRPAGRERAAAARERAERTEIAVDDGDRRRTMPAAAVPAAVPEAPATLVATLAGLTDEGVLYTDTAVESGTVDRETAMATVEEVVQTVREGNGAVLLVSGPDGIGKTRILEAVAERIDAAGGTVRRATCRPGASRAYEPLSQALGDAVDAILAETSIPALDALESGGTLEAGRAALFHDVAAVLREEAGDGPVVLAIDDLHDADEATRSLLGRLATDLADAPVGIVGTYRPRLGSGEGEGGAIEDRFAPAAVTRIDLEPLDPEATAQLVEQVVGTRAVPRAFTRAVHEHTGGNPRFVEACVERLLEEGVVDPATDRYPTGDLPVPAVVEETIGQRLTDLSPSARTVLACAAVIGDPVPRQLLGEVSELSHGVVETLVDSLVDDGMLATGADDTVSFESQARRRAVLERIPATRRRALHREVAEAMEAVSAADASQAATIAEHYEAAGDVGRAVAEYSRAAEAAQAVYAHETALEHYGRALALASEADRHEEVLDVLESTADVYFLTGDGENADRHYQYVERRCADDRRRQRVLLRRAQLRTKRGDFSAALEHVDRGLDLDAETPEASRLLGVKGWALTQLGEFSEAFELLETARERAEALEDPTLIGLARYKLGTALVRRGDNEEAIPHLEAAVEAFDESEETHHHTNALGNLATVRWKVGERRQAIADLERTLELLRRVGDQVGLTTALNNLAVFKLTQCEWEEAREHLAETLEKVRTLDNRKTETKVLGNFGNLHLCRGELDEARAYYEERRDLADRIDSPFQVTKGLVALADVDLWEGHLERADRSAETALQRAEEIGIDEIRALALERLGNVAYERNDIVAAVEYHEECIALADELGATKQGLRGRIALAREYACGGRGDEAVEIAAEAAERAIDVRNPFHHARSESARGMGLLATGDIQGAADAFDAAIEAAVEHEARLVECEARYWQGVLRRTHGSPDAATESLEAALVIATDCGADLYADRVRDLLADG